MAHLIAKKQEEWNSQKVRELLKLPENKKCFDCPTKSPFFVNMSIQTFICTRCSGLVREVGHRVKSISASKFSGPEIVTLQHGGNAVAQSLWLSTYNMSTAEPETDADIRLFMRQKYYEQKWLNREKAVLHSENIKQIITEMFREDGSRRNRLYEVPRKVPFDSKIESPKRHSLDIRPPLAPTQSWLDDNVPIGLISTVQNNKNIQQTPDLISTAMNNLLLDDDPIPYVSPIQPTAKILMDDHKTVPSRRDSEQSDIFTELAELQSSPTQPIKPIYTGDILQPSSPLLSTQPVKSIYTGDILQPNSPLSPTINSSPLTSSFQSKVDIRQSQQKRTSNYTLSDFDPYAALRGLSTDTNTPISTSTYTPKENTFNWQDSMNQPRSNRSSMSNISSMSNRSSIYNQSVNTSSDLFRDLDTFYKR
ncbi:hypothetical protein BDB01DRAFT_847793 [Pilobolus umbonatus]|nr:hypothetical protein BDB01DRAFT_847793 [Pilobolus umbonatus]